MRHLTEISVKAKIAKVTDENEFGKSFVLLEELESKDFDRSHTWIESTSDFTEESEGKSIMFVSDVISYCKRDGKKDYGLKNIRDILFVEDKVSPITEAEIDWAGSSKTGKISRFIR